MADDKAKAGVVQLAGVAYLLQSQPISLWPCDPEGPPLPAAWALEIYIIIWIFGFF